VARRKTLVNRRVKSRVKTVLDAVKITPSGENVSQAFSMIDRAVKKNLFHRNKAARMKSQLSRLVVAK